MPLLVLIALSLLISASPSPATAQISSVGTDRHTVINARAAALADAYTAMAPDVASMYWNPANLAFLESNVVSASFALEKPLIGGSLQTINLSVPVALRRGLTAGFGVTSHWTNTPAEDSVFGRVWITQYVIDAAVAYRIGETVSVGVLGTARVGMEPIEGTQASAIGLALGVYYHPIPEISYAFAVRGLGSTITHPYDDPPSALLPARRTNQPGSIEVGISTKFPAATRSPIVRFSIGSQKVLKRDGVIYKSGVECWVWKFAALRLGYWADPGTAVAARFGIGLKAYGIQLDYAVSSTRVQPRFHQITIAAPLL